MEVGTDRVKTPTSPSRVVPGRLGTSQGLDTEGVSPIRPSVLHPDVHTPFRRP